MLGAIVSEMFIPVEIGKIVKDLVTDYSNISIIKYTYIMIGLAAFSTLFSTLTNVLRIKMKENPVFGIQKNTLFKLFCLGIPYFEKKR